MGMSRKERDELSERLKLESKRLCLQNALPCMQDAELHIHYEHTLKSMILTLSTNIASCPIKEIHEKWPKDWWEAVKERWAPAWFTKRYPVVYTCLDVSITEYTTQIRMPQHLQPMIRIEAQNYASRLDDEDDD